MDRCTRTNNNNNNKALTSWQYLCRQQWRTVSGIRLRAQPQTATVAMSAVPLHEQSEIFLVPLFGSLSPPKEKGRISPLDSGFVLWRLGMLTYFSSPSRGVSRSSQKIFFCFCWRKHSHFAWFVFSCRQQECERNFKWPIVSALGAPNNESWGILCNYPTNQCWIPLRCGDESLLQKHRIFCCFANFHLDKCQWIQTPNDGQKLDKKLLPLCEIPISTFPVNELHPCRS